MRKLNAVVMTLAGALLIVAAILKAHEVLTVAIPSWQEKGIWESWEFLLVQIPAEFALGVWMVSGLFRKAAWLAGTCAYAFFIAVTLFKALAGAESCGCFGQVHVDPWITLFSIDIPFFLLLAVFFPRGQKLLPPPWPNIWHAIGTAIPIFAALLFTVPALVAFRPDFIKPENWSTQPLPVKPQPVEPNSVIEPVKPEPTTPPKVEPDTAEPVTPEPTITPTEPTPDKGQQEPKVVQPEAPKLWPWLAHIDIAEQLKNGVVVVYMYHHDCPVCAESIPKYEAYSKEMGAEVFKVAYVAIPPYGKDGSGPVPADTTALHGKLSDKQDWAITSPFVVALLDGSVVKQWPQGGAPEPARILDEIFGQ